MANKRPVFAINWAEVDALVAGCHDNPHHILGMHETVDGVYVNVYYPGAESVVVVAKNTKKKYKLVSDRVQGFFSIKIEDAQSFVYYLEVALLDGTKKKFVDPYAFEPVIDPIDISKFNDGIHYEIYEKLGAHPCTLDGVKGVLFAVWAPHAQRASVVGNFNSWNGKVHMMRRIEYSGIFELFIPELAVGEIYKFEIQTKSGDTFMKPDPYANFSELRPANASRVTDLSFEWTDDEYFKKNTMAKNKMPMNIYEIHLGAFKRPKDGREFYNYREIAEEIAKYVTEMGYTHVELMPIMEHELDSTYGYQTTAFYAPTSRYGEPQDFMYFVDYMHQHGIGVICDWVPSQFPMSENGLARFDGEPLYEPADSRRSENTRWGTYIFDYGRYEVKNYLISNAIYWISKYHLDGLRIDSVASMLYLDYGKSYGNWIPNRYGGNENLEAIAFFKELNTIINERFPGCMMIVEEDSGWPMLTSDTEEGGMGFDYRWNTTWMKDLLSYMALDPLYRKYEHKKLTNSLSTAYEENYILEFSHNEVIDGKGSIVDQMPGGYEEKFSNLRLLYGYMMMHPGKKLMFMGQEFAQFKGFNETSEIAWDLLDFDAHTVLRNYVKALNHLYKSEAALFACDDRSTGFEWINATSANESIVSFLRKTEKEEDTLLVVCNFTPVTHKEYVVGVPYAGIYKEIFCSDLEQFGGDGSRNITACKSRKIPADDRERSISIGLAPLSMSIFKLESRMTEKEEAEATKPTKKQATKKSIAKKSAATKTVAKKSVEKKSVAKKETDTKTVAKMTTSSGTKKKTATAKKQIIEK